MAASKRIPKEYKDLLQFPTKDIPTVVMPMPLTIGAIIFVKSIHLRLIIFKIITESVLMPIQANTRWLISNV